MRQILDATWHAFRTHVSHWFATGAVGAALGVSPDRWFEGLFQSIGIPEGAMHLWALEVHPRWVFIGLGGALMVGDVLGHRSRHGGNGATATQSIATTVAPVINVAPQINVDLTSLREVLARDGSDGGRNTKTAVSSAPPLAPLNPPDRCLGRDAEIAALIAALTRISHTVEALRAKAAAEAPGACL